MSTLTVIFLASSVALGAPAEAPSLHPPGPPIVQLSTNGYPPDVSDEQHYELYLDARTRAWVRAAESTTLPTDEIRFRLAAANWVLAQQIEPAVSRVLLGVQPADDQNTLAIDIALARAQLERARAILDAAPTTTQPNDPQAFDASVEQQLEVLETFAEALDAAFGTTDSEAVTQQRRSADFRLAILLEEEQPAVASAAVLWQAVLLDRQDRVDRALERLPLSTSPLGPGSLRFDFYARLLRCRYMAQQGRFVAACSLLMQIEQRCHEWFATKEERAEAERTAAWIRREVVTRWHDAFDPSAEKERRWCRQAVERIHQQLAKPGRRATVMRLGLAIPMLVEAELPPSPATQPATRPTTQPSN